MTAQTEPEATAQTDEMVSVPKAKLDELSQIADKYALLMAEIDVHDVDYRGGAWTDLWGTKTLTDDAGVETVHLIKVNVTEHSPINSQHALEGLLRTIKWAEEFNLRPYDKTRTIGKPPAAVPGPLTRAAAQQNAPAPASTPAPTVPPAPTGAPAPTSTPDAGEPINITKLVVTPRQDNRVDLALFAPNHQYADLKVTNWKLDSVLELLEPTGEWLGQHLAVAAEYPVNWIAHWEFSKKTSATGKPYKNLTSLELAG